MKREITPKRARKFINGTITKKKLHKIYKTGTYIQNMFAIDMNKRNYT